MIFAPKVYVPFLKVKLQYVSFCSLLSSASCTLEMMGLLLLLVPIENMFL
jgi:hypothetical protein